MDKLDTSKRCATCGDLAEWGTHPMCERDHHGRLIVRNSGALQALKDDVDRKRRQIAQHRRRQQRERARVHELERAIRTYLSENKQLSDESTQLLREVL